MDKTISILCLLALAGTAFAITKNPTASSTHVMVRMELDNTVKQVNTSMATLKKNIAKELCGVPETDVQILKVMDDSTTVVGVGNTQTLVYASCKAPVSKLEAVLDDCQDFWNQHQVKDETKDSTSWWKGGEVQVDDIECRYVEKGRFEYFSKADKSRADTQDKADAAAAATGAAGSALPAVVTALAAAGAAIALVL